MGDLSGRTALVTGGSRGIGSAICRALATDGAQVAVNYWKSEVSAKDVVERIMADGGQAVAVCCDVSDPEAVGQLILEVIEKFGGLDILVNNAGRAETGPIHDFSCEMWSGVMNVNFGGVFNCTKAVLPHFESQRSGVIANISSVLAEQGWAGSSVYAASKGAVSAFTRCCALEAAPYGVRVNAVLPGFTPTDLSDGALRDEGVQKALSKQIPLQRWATVEQIAEAVRYVVSPRASYLSGSSITIDGGISACLGLGKLEP